VAEGGCGGNNKESETDKVARSAHRTCLDTLWDGIPTTGIDPALAIRHLSIPPLVRRALANAGPNPNGERTTPTLAIVNCAVMHTQPIADDVPSTLTDMPL